LNNLGCFFNQIKQYDSAIYFLEKAISIKPDSSKTYQNLGVAYSMLGQNDLGLSFANKSILLDSTGSDNYVSQIRN
jgi:tetratricopeptide (TPR) repeat protein